MLYNLLFPYADGFAALNIFKYITFRTGGSIITALLISFMVGPSLIALLKKLQNGGQPIRELGPQSHLLTKKGTPTMGGLLILFSCLTSTLLWSDLKNSFVWITIFVTISFGILGFVDDYLKVTKRNHQGVSGKIKLAVQGLVSVVAVILIQSKMPVNLASELAFPFFKNVLWDLGPFFIIFSMIVIIGASNAVNLTDGLDGLVIVPVMIAAGCFGLISYLIGNSVFANYLQVHHIPGSGELAVFCGSLIGAGLGFLWFNAPPAKIFMGDTGSLALGGAIGTVSVITKHEIVLSIIGGLFVIEALSVIIQVYYFKLSGGKRVFKMAPLHHHFEKSGWSEATVVVRFWVIAVIFALIGLSTLKLR